MRSVELCSVAAALILFGAPSIAEPLKIPPQLTHHYWLLGVSTDNMVIQYADADSVASRSEDIRRGWIWQFNSTGAPRDAGAKFVMLEEANCRTNELHSLQFNFYDATGTFQPTQSEQTAEAWSYVTPDTLGESLLQFLCSTVQDRLWYGLPLFNSMTPEQHAHEFDAQRSFHMPTLDQAPHEMQSNSAPSAMAGSGK